MSYRSPSLRFDPPLVRATLLRRYKRFLADVELADGQVVTAHCANPGRMTGLLVERGECWVRDVASPARRLSWSLELVRVGSALVAVNTARTNDLVDAALRAGRLPSLGEVRGIRREVTRGASRFDFCLDTDDGVLWLEVKQTTLAVPPLGRFPDAPTVRGRRHLAELADAARAGERTGTLWVATRPDVERVAPAADVDPAYAEAVRDAIAAGMHAWACPCTVTVDALEISGEIPFDPDA